MVTIRTLLVVVLLVVPSMPASAGLADADAGWGDGGFVEVGFYAVGFSPEPDGTVWVVGYDIDTLEGRLAHIDQHGTIVASVPFEDDVPVGRIAWVGRTPDGFAIFTYTSPPRCCSGSVRQASSTSGSEWWNPPKPACPTSESDSW